MKEIKINIILFIFILVFLVYSNTFQSSWQFDDEPNILLNSNLHISELNLEQISRAMRAQPFSPESGNLYRPLPCLTFGLNWYFGQDNVWGYHLVNIAIHILTACFLFQTLRLLLRIHYQNYQKKSQQIEIAALLGALFWALAPIQTQAVTYIVQRMASMAAMFSIIAIYAYVRGRIAPQKKYRWFFLCVLSFFAALGSKENAILLLPSILLLEFAFFRHNITRRHVIFLVSAAAIIFIVAMLFIQYGLGLVPVNLSEPLSFLDSYSNRSFTFSERILTQPRIVLMYLSQIFIPLADRLSFEHDIVLSTSLFSPWTTLPAILVILLLIVIAFIFLKKYPLVCFPILFFFLNHVVESTVLQLELIFEHRNYLPSLFLFLPAGVLIAHILYSTPPQSAFRRTATAGFAIFFLIVSSHATYTRNLAWATEGTLWTDAIRKAPNSARAARYLGKWYETHGQDKIAYYYLRLALAKAKNDPSPEYARMTVLNQIGALFYDRQENKNALYFLNKCLDSEKYSASCLKNRILVFFRLKQFEKALSDAEILAHQYPDSIEYQYLTAFAAYQANIQDIALNRMQKVVSRSLGNYQVMYLTGLIMMKERAYPNSLFFLKRAVRLSPNDIDIQLALAAAYHASNQAALTEKLLGDIFKKYPLPVITNALQESQQQKWDSNTINFITTYLVTTYLGSMTKDSTIHEPESVNP